MQIIEKNWTAYEKLRPFMKQFGTFKYQSKILCERYKKKYNIFII